MLVCLCHPLSSGELEQLVEDGADSVEEIGRRCGAGTGCGACVEELAEAIVEQREDPEGVGRAARALCERLMPIGRSDRPRCSTGLVSVRSRAATV